MPQTQNLVTIFGGSGFVGRYIASRMARQGWRVRVAVRRPNEANYVRTYGTVGQVEPVQANIRDEPSTRAAIEGADAVINCVGILQETGKQKFDAVQAQGAERIARLAANVGVRHLVHLSAISPGLECNSKYARSKAKGEAAVLKAYPTAIVLRPSVIFGAEDDFFNRFAFMAKFTWVLPLVGADTKFQPVFVDDVAKAAVAALTGRAQPGVYELGGPRVDSFRGLMMRMLQVVRRRRLMMDVPFSVAMINAWFLDMGSKLTGGLLVNRILTRDQVRLLRHDNVVSEGARSLADLGVEATPMEAVLESYLYCHRDKGQYTAITDSTKNLSA